MSCCMPRKDGIESLKLRSRAGVTIIQRPKSEESHAIINVISSGVVSSCAVGPTPCFNVSVKVLWWTL